MGQNLRRFGETPELQKMMSFASVKGYQGDSLGVPNHILACANILLEMVEQPMELMPVTRKFPKLC